MYYYACMVILLCKTQHHLKSCKELDQIKVCAQKLTHIVTLNLVTSLLAKCDMRVTMGHCASTLFEGIADTYIYSYSIYMADVIMHHSTRPNMAMSQCRTLQNGLCVSNMLYTFVLICGLCSIFGMNVINVEAQCVEMHSISPPALGPTCDLQNKYDVIVHLFNIDAVSPRLLHHFVDKVVRADLNCK